MIGTFVLVGCGAAKREETTEARDLYTSNYFALKRRYAEAATAWAGKHQHVAWAILSAEHGVIPPRYTTEPYDTTVSELTDDELDDWTYRVSSGLTSWLNWPFRSDNNHRESPCKRLLVLAGKSYVDPLRESGAFKGRHVSLPCVPQFPFEENELGGIGEQMAWLKTESERLETEAAPRSQGEWSAFGGPVREFAPWERPYAKISVEETKQADLFAFEDVEDRFIAKRQQKLVAVTDGGDDRV